MTDDITETLAPKSEQLDGIDLISGPRIFTVERVVVNQNPGADQPVTVHLREFPRPWKPGKNMRRVLGYCWGNKSSEWVGHRVELFYDPDVQYGGKDVGGSRIRRLSDIDGVKKAPILLSQGRPGTYKVEPLPEPTDADRIASLRREWANADDERRAVIEAEVAKLSKGAES